MPTYAYRCTACAHEFEAVQKMSDNPLTTCPECGAPIKRVIFPAGIVFKGDGWYITDSRKSNDAKAKSGKATEDTSTASDKTEKAPSDNKDSAPAPAADAKPAKAVAD
ncbi:MAG: zinc ribbon domain-containing protein [Thermomicrobiales bacterium]